MSTAQLEESEKTEEDHHQDQKPEYLMVRDLPRQVHAFTMAGLKVPPRNHDIFLHIAERMGSLFTQALGHRARLRVIDMQDLSEEILAEAHRVASCIDEAFIVSTCAEIAMTAQGMTMNVNRVIDLDENSLGIEERPGFPQLQDQIKAVVALAKGRPIVLVEDGLFTGGTVCRLVQAFCAAGASVEAVVVGFAFPKGLEKVKSLPVPPKVYCVETLHDPWDWVPDHDFFPYVPNCGRVVGVRHPTQQISLMYSQQGAAYSVPYLHKFCPMGKWTGMTWLSNKALCNLTWHFLDLDHQLFRVIEKCNGGRHLTVNDLLKTRPRLALPCRLNQPLPVMDNSSVLTHLNNLLMEFQQLDTTL